MKDEGWISHVTAKYVLCAPQSHYLREVSLTLILVVQQLPTV